MDPFELPGITATVDGGVPTLQEFISLIKTKNLARQERFFVSLNLPEGIATPNQSKDLQLLCEEAALPGKQIQTSALRINGLDEHRGVTASFGDEITLQFLIDTDFTARYVMEKWMEQVVSNPNGIVNGTSNITKGREVGYYGDYATSIVLNALIPAGVPGEKIANYSPTQADSGLREGLQPFIDNAPPGTSLAMNKLMQRGSRAVDNLAARAKSQTLGRINNVASPLLELFRDIETVAFQIELKECFPINMNVMPVSFSNPGVHRLNVTFKYKYWESKVVSSEGLEDKIVNSINGKVGDLLKKKTEKIPSTDLGKLGSNLSEKWNNLTGRFGV